MNYQKYHKLYFDVPPFARTWPGKQITSAPRWCSVDLRDGNQALFSPMTLEEKVAFFKLLVKIGFKEIEVGFPAASETEYQFTRYLIENDLIPEDVTIQVLTQSRDHIIKKTVEALEGAHHAIIHLYNSTSALQREVVFRKSREEIIQLAVDGVHMIQKYADDRFSYEYSPESFSCTEMDFAAEICNAVIREFAPTPEKKLIINLPTSVEVSTPNIYADQVEYMSQHLERRDSVIVSVHTHNDRGTGVASSELALLAGAQRVEGTLFGNGERTGNADIAVIALNMFSVGIDPQLNLDNLEEIIDAYKKFNKLPIHPRHPYAGAMAYTAFSGSHQDAIKKAMDYCETHKQPYWQNPYLTIDPTDLNRVYEPILINSQSGKGGLSYVLETKFGLTVPKALLQEFSATIKIVSDGKHTVLEPEEIYDIFEKYYVNLKDKAELVDYHFKLAGEEAHLDANVKLCGKTRMLSAQGNGPLDALSNALRAETGKAFEIVFYNEHALEGSSSSKAATYIAINDTQGNMYWGVGIHPNINTSSVLALLSAFGKLL